MRSFLRRKSTPSAQPLPPDATSPSQPPPLAAAPAPTPYVGPLLDCVEPPPPPAPALDAADPSSLAPLLPHVLAAATWADSCEALLRPAALDALCTVVCPLPDASPSSSSSCHLALPSCAAVKSCASIASASSLSSSSSSSSSSAPAAHPGLPVSLASVLRDPALLAQAAASINARECIATASASQHRVLLLPFVHTLFKTAELPPDYVAKATKFATRLAKPKHVMRDFLLYAHFLENDAVECHARSEFESDAAYEAWKHAQLHVANTELAILSLSAPSAVPRALAAVDFSSTRPKAGDSASARKRRVLRLPTCPPAPVGAAYAAIVKAVYPLLPARPARRLLDVLAARWHISDVHRIALTAEQAALAVFSTAKSVTPITFLSELTRHVATIADSPDEYVGVATVSERALLGDVLALATEIASDRLNAPAEFYPPSQFVNCTECCFRLLTNISAISRSHFDDAFTSDENIPGLLKSASKSLFSSLIHQVPDALDLKNSVTPLASSLELATLVKLSLTRLETHTLAVPEFEAPRKTIMEYLAQRLFLIVDTEQMSVFANKIIAKSRGAHNGSDGVRDLNAVTLAMCTPAASLDIIVELHDVLLDVSRHLRPRRGSADSGTLENIKAIQHWLVDTIDTWMTRSAYLICEHWVPRAISCDDFLVQGNQAIERSHTVSLIDVFSALHQHLHTYEEVAWPTQNHKYFATKRFLTVVSETIAAYTGALRSLLECENRDDKVAAATRPSSSNSTLPLPPPPTSNRIALSTPSKNGTVDSYSFTQVAVPTTPRSAALPQSPAIAATPKSNIVKRLWGKLEERKHAHASAQREALAASLLSPIASDKAVAVTESRRVSIKAALKTQREKVKVVSSLLSDAEAAFSEASCNQLNDVHAALKQTRGLFRVIGRTLKKTPDADYVSPFESEKSLFVIRVLEFDTHLDSAHGSTSSVSSSATAKRANSAIVSQFPRQDAASGIRVSAYIGGKQAAQEYRRIPATQYLSLRRAPDVNNIPTIRVAACKESEIRIKIIWTRNRVEGDCVLEFDVQLAEAAKQSSIECKLWRTLNENRGRVMISVTRNETLYLKSSMHGVLQRVRADRDAMIFALASKIYPRVFAAVRTVLDDSMPIKEHKVSSSSPLNNLLKLRSSSAAVESSKATHVLLERSIRMEDIAIQLNPLFEYLNTSFATLNAHLSPQLLRGNLFRAIWNKFLAVMENFVLAANCNPNGAAPAKSSSGHLLAPSSLHPRASDVAAKPYLTLRRRTALGFTLQLLYDFFYADGEGMPQDALESREFFRLKSILTLYEERSEVLIRSYVTAFSLILSQQLESLPSKNTVNSCASLVSLLSFTNNAKNQVRDAPPSRRSSVKTSVSRYSSALGEHEPSDNESHANENASAADSEQEKTVVLDNLGLLQSPENSDSEDFAAADIDPTIMNSRRPSTPAQFEDMVMKAKQEATFAIILMRSAHDADCAQFLETQSETNLALATKLI